MTPDDITRLADGMEFRARHAQQNGGTVPHDVLKFYAAELRTLAKQGKADGVAVYEVQERLGSLAPSSRWTETSRETYEGGYFPETLFHRRILYTTPPAHSPDAGVTDEMVERLAKYIAQQESHKCTSIDAALHHQATWKRIVPEARAMLTAALAPQTKDAT